MDLPVDDRLAIHELLALHGHVMDDGAFDRLGELFTDDVRYDVSALGGDVLIGPEAIAQAALQLGAGNPVAHHVTNVVVTDARRGRATVRSKGLGVRTDGSVGSVTYEDEVVHVPGVGWRIAVRRVLPRRAPLSAG